MVGDGKWDRRSVLKAAGLVAVAAAIAPGVAWAATDADALFRAGKFEQAGRAYEEIPRGDPGNVRAASQRGYVGLLANKFADAEKYLRTAVELAPGDQAVHRFLAGCYTRQDKFSLAAPHWRAAGEESYAKVSEAIGPQPCRVHGEFGQARWTELDPIARMPVSLNGGPPRSFAFYTRIGPMNVSAAVAREAGLQAVAEDEFEYLGKIRRACYGILGSFKLGGIELRDVPVRWPDVDDGPGPDGMIGTWVLYHFLSTIDYAGRSLILRRRTPETARQVRLAAERAGAEPLPLWLAREQLTFSRGSFADSGTQVVGLHIGGTGNNVAGMWEGTARELRIRTDYDRPEETSAGGQAVVVHPCYPKEVRVGNATAKGAYSVASVRNLHDGHGFDVLGDIAHSFYKPYNVTLDFVDMKVHIARGAAGLLDQRRTAE